MGGIELTQINNEPQMTLKEIYIKMYTTNPYDKRIPVEIQCIKAELLIPRKSTKKTLIEWRIKEKKTLILRAKSNALAAFII